MMLQLSFRGFMTLFAGMVLMLPVGVSSTAYALDLSAVAAQDPPLWRDQRERERQQWLKLMWDDYIVREDREAKHDDLVKEAVERAAELLTGATPYPSIDRPLLERLNRPARRDDSFPAVGHFAHYTIKRKYYPISQRQFSRWVVPRGLDAFMADLRRSQSDDDAKRYATLMEGIMRTFQMASFDRPKREQVLPEQVAAAQWYLGLITDAIINHDKLDEPAILLDVFDDLSELNDIRIVRFMHQHLLDNVLQQEDIPRWLRSSITAQFGARFAWIARGRGWARDVEAEGWQQFRDAMNYAYQHVKIAWHDNPAEPRISALGARIAPHVESERSMEQWVLLAQQAGFGHMDTLWTMSHFSRPRWGGSWERLYAIARGTLDTGRFDIKLTDGFIVAMRIAIDEGVTLDRMDTLRPFLQRADVQESINQWYAGATDPALNASPERLAEVAQIRAFMYYHCDDLAAARDLMATVDKDLLNENLAQRWRVDPKNLLDQADD